MLASPGADPGPPASVDRPNVLMVVLDTVRADHLGIYGYARGTTPFLDRFAETAIVFERAVADSNWTLPSHATLFTGLYPESHATDMVTADSHSAIDVSAIRR